MPDAFAQVPSPRVLAEAVADQTVERTRFELVPGLAPVVYSGAYRLDVFDGFAAHAGGLYVAKARLTVDEDANANVGAPRDGGLAAVALGVSHARGAVEVRLNGERVLAASDDDAPEMGRPDYGVFVYEHTVRVPLTPGEHELEVRFTPSTDADDGGRLYLGFVDGPTGLNLRGMRIEAPHVDGAAFAVLGPLPADAAVPEGVEVPVAYDGAHGEPVRWGVDRRVVASQIADDLYYSDWRYFSGTILDAMHTVSRTFDGLDYGGYIDQHLDFFQENIEQVAAERDAHGLLTGPFGHYFRYALLDDIGMQTVPYLERLRRTFTTRTLPEGVLDTPDGRLVRRGLDHFMTESLRLPDGTFARVNPDTLTVWADDLFMAGILLMRAALHLDGPLAMARGESVYLEEVIDQTLAIDRYLRDPETNVYHHGYFASTAERSSSRWGRANGWTMLAKTQLLTILPEQNPRYGAVLEVFQRHAAGLLALQSEDGRWHQVLDNPETFRETTATAAFVYAFATGLAEGWLPAEGEDGASYREAVERGWAALGRQVRPEGTVDGIVPGTPIYFEDAQYQARGPRVHDPRGLGAMLYAASAVHTLYQQEAEAAEAHTFRVTNSLDAARPDAFVVVPRADLAGLPATPLQVTHDGTVLAAQQDDLDGDGRWDELAFVLDLDVGETAEVQIEAVANAPTVTPRTQADIRVKEGGRFMNGFYEGGAFTRYRALDVPAEQQQDSKYAFAEGPTWETDRVGFRVYLDERARVDVFGKTGGPPVLHAIEGNYHAIQDWGTDVLKVGASLGLGTPAALTDFPGDTDFQTLGTPDRLEVVASGPARSILRWTVDDWEVFRGEGTVSVRAVWEVEVRAGQRHTLSRLTTTWPDGTPIDLQLATGIVRHDAAPDLVTTDAGAHLVAYTWGDQADQGDGLGLGLVLPGMFRPAPVTRDDTYAFTLQPEEGRIHYLLAAAWALEDDPLDSADAFEAYLTDAAERSAAPVTVRRAD